MKRTRIPCIPGLPECLKSFTRTADLYDSSCSPDARVWFADRDGGFFIKTAPKETLKTEAEMSVFFHSRGLGPEVLAYASPDSDWMVTRAAAGEDCTHPLYCSDPMKLSETAGQLLRMLHETDGTGCPVTDRNTSYIQTALRNHEAGIFGTDYGTFPSMESAWTVVQTNLDCLDSQVLLHGDYCLPNIMLDNWRFSGFIDVGCGGIGDRHIDLYWGCWTLLYNLKDEKWCSRFLDAYGRQDVDTEKLRILAAFEVFG